MTGSDPSGKTHEIDLTGVDLSAGLDLELRVDRPAESSARKSVPTEERREAEAEPSARAPEGDRTVVIGGTDAGADSQGTIVDLALDLLEPTRIVSLAELSLPAPSSEGAPEVSAALKSTVALALIPAPAATSHEPSSEAAEFSLEAAEPLAGEVAAPPREAGLWGEVDAWMARLDRLLGSPSAGPFLSGEAEEEKAPTSDEEEPALRAESPSIPGGRDGLDQAIAFLEMDAFESARGALRFARGSDPGLAAQCDVLLAWLALRENRPHEALRICEEWRGRVDLSQDELREFRYQAARSLEALGRSHEARAEYAALLASSPGGYRDCRVRLRRLRSSQ